MSKNDPFEMIRAGRVWMDAGACNGIDPNIFFPYPGESQAAAKEICRSCVLQPGCLKYAIDNNIQHGIWGGVGESERIRMARRQRRAAEAAAATAKIAS